VYEELHNWHISQNLYFYWFSAREIKSQTAMAKAAFNNKTLFTSKLGINLRKKLVKCYIWFCTPYGAYAAKTWTFRKADQKYLERFEIWCWKRLEKIRWTDHVKNEVWHRVMEEKNILRIRKRTKAKWNGNTLGRNCLLKHIIEGNMGREGEEEEVSCYRVELENYTGKWSRKH